MRSVRSAFVVHPVRHFGRQADVGCGCESAQASFFFCGQSKTGDEITHFAGSDLVATGQLLQTLVRVRHSGRDGCRVPLPWTSDGSSMGFGPEGGAAPWLPQPDRFRALARGAQLADPDSILALYRRLARLRPSLLGDAHRVEWIEAAAPSVLAFRAGELVCATNTGSAHEAFDAPEGAEFLLNTAGDLTSGVLAADSTSW